jgi:hypothetical protein
MHNWTTEHRAVEKKLAEAAVSHHYSGEPFLWLAGKVPQGINSARGQLRRCHDQERQQMHLADREIDVRGGAAVDAILTSSLHWILRSI